MSEEKRDDHREQVRKQLSDAIVKTIKMADALPQSVWRKLILTELSTIAVYVDEAVDLI